MPKIARLVRFPMHEPEHVALLDRLVSFSRTGSDEDYIDPETKDVYRYSNRAVLWYKLTIQDKPSFQDWMILVNKELHSICKLTYEDLPDQCWHDWYDDEIEPKDAAIMCLEDCGFPFEEKETN